MKKKRMIYMKILKKKGGVVEKRGEEETKFMPHAPVVLTDTKDCNCFITLIENESQYEF
jgi:hypothetical protein